MEKMENMENIKIQRLYIEPCIDEIIEDVRLSITDEYRIKEQWNREFLSRLEDEYNVQNLDIVWDKPTLGISCDIEGVWDDHELYRKTYLSVREIEKQVNEEFYQEVFENQLEKLFFVLDPEQKIVHGWGETLEKAVEMASIASIESISEIYKCFDTRSNWNFYSKSCQIKIDDDNIISFIEK